MDEATTRTRGALLTAAVMMFLVAPLMVVLLGVGVFVAMGDAQAQSCTTAGGASSTLLAHSRTPGAQVGDLNPAQMDSATIIVAVGEQLQVPARGIVIALAVASEESSFQNLANNGTDPRLRPEQRDVVQSLGYPHDGVGHDHASVDAFQQQFPGWGTVAELMNPPTAARKFYQALLRVPGWAAMPVTVAAQTVQRSQYPQAYAVHETRARALYLRLAGAGASAGNLLATTPAPCTGGAAMSCPPTGLAAEHGLTPDALAVLRCVQQNFGNHTYTGVDGVGGGGGGGGHALDVTIPAWNTPTGTAAGTILATWVTTHAAALGVSAVTWAGRRWAADNAATGWQPSTPAPDGVVHIAVHGNAGAGVGVGVGVGVGAGAVSATGWSLPLDRGTYTLSSGYGPRPSPTGGSGSFHAGLDFAAPTGTPIRAAAPGVVTYAGFNNGGFGNLVIIATAPNILTYYAHQSALAVATGAQVTAGQVVGAVGTTGDSTGPHLHFEVHVDGATTDPLPYLRQRGLDPGTLSGST